LIKKTIIKTCAKLSYQTAQLIIDGKIKCIEDFPQNQKPKNVDLNLFIEKIKLMNEIA